MERWIVAMLDDGRFSDYFARRLERPYVGVEAGPFLIYRKDRFRDWLSTQLRQNRPYDEMVAQMIASRGLWTSNEEVNFVTVARVEDNFDENQLTARVSRAFLGQCASTVPSVIITRSTTGHKRSMKGWRALWSARSVAAGSLR